MKQRSTSNLKDKEEENTQSKQKKKNPPKTENSIRSLQDNFKHTDSHILEVSKENRVSKEMTQ